MVTTTPRLPDELWSIILRLARRMHLEAQLAPIWARTACTVTTTGPFSCAVIERGRFGMVFAWGPMRQATMSLYFGTALEILDVWSQIESASRARALAVWVDEYNSWLAGADTLSPPWHPTQHRAFRVAAARRETLRERVHAS